jgi:hypothetical protein
VNWIYAGLLTSCSRLSELEAKVALYEGGRSINQSSQDEVGRSEPCEASGLTAQLDNVDSPLRQISALDHTEQDVIGFDFDVHPAEQLPVGDQTTQEFSPVHVVAETPAELVASPEEQSSPESELMNPLALGVSTFTPNAKSIPSL